MLYHSEEESPVVLVVSENGTTLPHLIIDFLNDNSLDVELIELNQKFFLDYKQLVSRTRRIHKIIFIFGIHSVSPAVYRMIFDFFKLLYAVQEEKIPMVMISSIMTSLEILDDFNYQYQEAIKKQNLFIKDFLNEFDQSLIFLAQDLLVDGKNLTYPLLLFFSAFKQGYLFNPQSKFYFQDELSFFNLIKGYLIKPHTPARFLIKGSVLHSDQLTAKIIYFYEQYFQKKLLTIRLFADDQKQDFLQEFSLVNNAKNQIEPLLDEIIREINSFDQEIMQSSPTDVELAKALRANELQERNKKKSQKPTNIKEEAQSDYLLDLTNQAQNSPSEALPERENSFDLEFVDKIEKLFLSVRKTEKQSRQNKNISQGKKIIKKSKKRKILFWLGSFGFSTALILLFMFFVFNSSQKILNQQLLESVKNNGEGVENIDKSIIYKLFNFQLSQYEKVFLEESLTTSVEIRTLTEVLLPFYKSGQDEKKAIYDLYKKTFEGGVSLEVFYDAVEQTLDQRIEAQKLFNSYLSSLNMELYQGEEKQIWQSAINKGKEEIKINLQLKRFFTPFREFIFQPGIVNVLVLFQDSSELRSTGGFLTEIVLLSFNNGALLNKQILDVEDLDKRVYGHRQAPIEIKELLGEETLFLRDSNWQTDFSNSSQEIQWFVEQATGSKVDLALALNTKDIPGFKAGVFLEKLLNLNKEQFTDFGFKLITLLNQKEILLQANNQKLQQAIEANSWSGQKIKVICPSEFKQETCLTDSIFQVENNVGINKVNPFIKETIEHNIGISKTMIRHKRKITFENLVRSEVWPLGSYKNYLKLYINPRANIERIELDGQKIDEGRFKLLKKEENLEFSILLETARQKKTELIVTYLIPNSMESPFSYVFLDQKQPGIFAKKTDYNIVFDSQFKPRLIAPTATYLNKVIHFENDNLDHFFFSVDFESWE